FRAILQTVAIALVSLAVVYYLIFLIKPNVIEYNVANIKKLTTFDLNRSPRKIISFYNYFTSYPRDAKDFLFGSGPGTFNSRSAFMVGSPSYFDKVGFFKDEDQPYYFKNYAYTLWNESNTSQALYLDGFRNQPFSSILAFLGEYGFIFTIWFFILYYIYYKKVSAGYRLRKSDRRATTYFRFIKILIVLLPLLLL